MDRVVPVAVAGTALVVTVVVAKRGVPEWERRAYTMINDLPDRLAPLAWPVMQFGSLTSPFALGALAYWRSRRLEPAAPIIAAGSMAWIAAKGVKMLVGRGRPHDFNQETNLRLWTEIDGSRGFVSGHAAVAFACAGIIRRNASPLLGGMAYGLAGTAGLCRIYAGAHLPVDVIGGAALGVIIAETVTDIRRFRAP